MFQFDLHQKSFGGWPDFLSDFEFAGARVFGFSRLGLLN
jgi:hypothetical protein